MKQLKEYQKYQEDTHELRILVRCGDPIEFSSLLLVNYRNADKVFIFRDYEDDEPDFGVDRAFFSLTRGYAVQGKDAEKDTAAPPATTPTLNTVDIIVETLWKDTADLINRFHPRKMGICDFKTSAFSTAQILGQKYADILPSQGNVILCNLNFTLPFFLNAVKDRAGKETPLNPRFVLFVSKEQEETAMQIYRDQRFQDLWVHSPIICHTNAELCEKLVDSIDHNYRTLFVMSEANSLTSGGDHRNFELWAALLDELKPESEILKNNGNGIFFEMHDETEAQIMEGFEFVQCVITGNLITEHITNLYKKMEADS